MQIGSKSNPFVRSLSKDESQLAAISLLGSSRASASLRLRLSPVLGQRPLLRFPRSRHSPVLGQRPFLRFPRSRHSPVLGQRSSQRTEVMS